MRRKLSADLYLDAILGTGFRPPVSGLYAEVIADYECERRSRSSPWIFLRVRMPM